MSITWDPFGPLTNTADIQLDDTEIVKKFEYYRSHPERPRIILACWIGLTIILWFVTLSASASGGSSGDLRLLFYALVPPIYYYNVISRVQKETAELVIAQQCGWSYDPKEDSEKGSLLLALYPELSDPNAHDPLVREQFWGTVGSNQTPFWGGVFQYTVGSGKYAHTYTKTLYALKLPRPAAGDFLLEPANGLFSTFGKSDITTESTDFNRHFRITYHGDRLEMGEKIFQTLTPPAQEHLLALRQSAGPFSLIFRQECMMISLSSPLKLKYTNFFRTVALDPRDEASLVNQLNSILQLSDEILPCLD